MKINSYHTNSAEIDMALRTRKDYFGTETPPPSTLMLVPELAVRGATVTNDIVALASDAKLDREGVHKETKKTALPTQDLVYGHRVFIQATRGGGLIFTQGKNPTRMTGAVEEIFGHPDFPYRDHQIAFQTEFILDYYKALLEDMGSSLENVVKADLHMCDMKDIAGMDEVWRKFFPKDPPARTIIPTDIAVVPSHIEIELIAIDPRGPYKKEVISTPKAPQPIGHESQAVKAGPYVFLSGQMATDYKHGIAPEAQVAPDFPFHSSSIKRQVKYILKNAEILCQAAGTSTKNLVRRRAIHFDLKELAEAEEVWREALGDRLPPTIVFRSSTQLPVPSCTVQYDLVAFVSSGA